MFYQLLYIHLFRPFLKYNQNTSPLPPQVSPRRLCTQAAATISKLLRLYKRTYGLRQICNIAVYIAHSACTIHLLNLPDKAAKRDIVYGVRHLEEIAEGWPCASRTLSILKTLAQKWKISLPEEAATVLGRLEYVESSREDSSSPKVATLLSNPTRHAAAAAPVSGSDLAPPGVVPGAPPPRERPRACVHSSQSPGSAVDSPVPYAHPLPPSRSVVDGLTRPPVDPSAATATAALSSQPTSAATVLGSTHGLVQESQDWWYKDQSAYHIGFENWHGYSPDQSLSAVPDRVPYTQPDAPPLDGLGNLEWYG